MNRSAIILLFLANAISGMAQGMSMIAIPWYFAQKGALPFFGSVYIVSNILSLFWVPISGTIVDKYDRKKIFLFLTTIVGSIILCFSLYGYAVQELSMYMVGAIFIITFLNYNIHYPCLHAFVQEISAKDKYAKMTSILEIIGQLTTIMAGAGATLLLEGTTNGELVIFGFPIHIGLDITAWKIHEIFLIDGITYFVAFAIILMIRYIPISKRKKEGGSILVRIKTGLKFLNSNRPILWYGILSFMVFTGVLLEAFYLGVNYVKNHLMESGDVYANSKMAYSMGAIVIGLLIAQLYKKLNLVILTIIFTIVTTITFLYLSFNQSLFTFFILMLLIGICNAGTRIVRITYLFKNVPNQFFGRTGSVFFIFHTMLRIVLLLIFQITFFHESNNIIVAYQMMSVLLAISAIVLIFKYKTFDLSLQTEAT